MWAEILKEYGREEVKRGQRKYDNFTEEVEKKEDLIFYSDFRHKKFGCCVGHNCKWSHHQQLDMFLGHKKK
jgi:hypothetical protein